MTRLTVTLLTAEAFDPYGEVIEAGAYKQNFPINDGHTQRFHDLANVDVEEQGGKTLINIFRSSPLGLPIKLGMMERHPLGSQAFMPLGSEPYLVVVAPAGEFDVQKIEVFLARSNQGVNYAKGTWHHYCLALNQASDFLVIDRGGEGNNCDVVSLDGSLEIDALGIQALIQS